jgi:hypothetical protein
MPRLELEANLQMNTSAQVLWFSDGGRGFWWVYCQCFAHCAIGILDFYEGDSDLS